MRGRITGMCTQMQAAGSHHDEAEVAAILNRMSRAIGHFEAVKKMYGDGADCSEVLIQLSAVKSAVNGIGREILKEHLTHCVLASDDGEAALNAIALAIDKFMK